MGLDVCFGFEWLFNIFLCDFVDYCYLCDGLWGLKKFFSCGGKIVGFWGWEEFCFWGEVLELNWKVSEIVDGVVFGKIMKVCML